MLKIVKDAGAANARQSAVETLAHHIRDRFDLPSSSLPEIKVFSAQIIDAMISHYHELVKMGIPPQPPEHIRSLVVDRLKLIAKNRHPRTADGPNSIISFESLDACAQILFQ